jgi:NADH:ubiquinone oxidoreductase subunit F (NADH-binding)
LIRRICHAMQKASLCGLGQTAPTRCSPPCVIFEEEYLAYIEGGPVRPQDQEARGGRNLQEVV